MQEKIWSKLNLHDQVGYLMVGGLTLLIIAKSARTVYRRKCEILPEMMRNRKLLKDGETKRR